MKYWIVLLVLIAGCEYEKEEYRYQSTLDAVMDWRGREAPYEYQADGLVDVRLAIEIRDQVYEEIKYNCGKADGMYLQDSIETEGLGSGVCVDRAILVYMRLRDAGFPDNAIGLVEFNHPGESINHVVCALFPNGDKYDDSHWVLLGTLKQDHYPILGYSLFDFWEY